MLRGFVCVTPHRSASLAFRWVRVSHGWDGPGVTVILPEGALQPGTAGSHSPLISFRLNPNVQRWTTTAWTSLWAAAQGQMLTCRLVLLP